jgi:hypothetical protein
MLTAAQGSIVVTGSASTATIGEPASAGSIVVTGFAATLVVGHVLNAATGPITLTGNASTAAIGEPVAAGVLTVTGYDATLTVTTSGKVLTADYRALVVTGGNADLTVQHMANAFGGGRGYKDKSGQPKKTETDFAHPPHVPYPEPIIGRIYHPLISDRGEYAESLIERPAKKPKQAQPVAPEPQDDPAAQEAARREQERLAIIGRLTAELRRTQEATRAEAIRKELARLDAERLRAQREETARLNRLQDEDDAYFMLLAA